MTSSNKGSSKSPISSSSLPALSNKVEPVVAVPPTDNLINTDAPVLDIVEPLSSEPESHPEGGFGWLVVLTSFLVHAIAIGSPAVYGVYQEFYIDQQVFPGSSNVQIAFVGSLMTAGLPLFAVPSGLIADWMGYRLTSICGGIFITVALVLASFSTQLWHLFLTQGFLFGVATSIAYFPAISIISQYFERRRGLATGLAVAGSGVGGFALSPLTSFLINTMGWRWALRITGLGGGALVIVCAFSFIQRFPSARRGVDFSLFKDPTFLGLFMMAAIVCFGYFSPFFYLPSYAVYNGLSSQQGSLIAGLLNLGSGIGRIFWGFTADRTFGLMNSLCICLSVASLSVLLMWPFVHDFAGIAIFGIIYGSFVGGFISLLPTLIASSFSKRGNLATVIGMVYSGFFFGNLFGTPIAGSLLDRNTVVSPVDGSKTSNYLPSILLAGFIIMLGSLIMISVRIRRSNILFKRV